MKRSYILFTALVILAGTSLLQAQPPPWYDFAFSPLIDKSVELDGIEWNSMCRVKNNPFLAWVTGDSGKVRSYALEDTLDLVGVRLLNEYDLGVKYTLCDAFFLDSLHGWIAGYLDDESDSSGRGMVWSTYNGGTIWMPSCNLPHSVYRYNLPFLRIEFSNRYFGWIRGEGDYLYRTTDGGITWWIEEKK